MSDADRLTRLEERYVHLQKHIAEQDRAMLEMSDEIKRLRTEVAALRALLNAQSSGEPPAASEERPPHY
jgi:SlyX protein